MKLKIKSSKLKTDQGYTLLEAIIYLTILAFISVLVVNTLLLMIRSFFESRKFQALHEAGTSIMERLAYDIRRASSADGDFGVNPGRLVLMVDNADDTQTLVEFKLDIGVIITSRGVNQWLPVALAARGDPANILGVEISDGTGSSLHPDYISVDNLVFRHIVTPVSEAVKIELTLEDLSGSTPVSETFYDTIVLRGSY